MEANSPLLNKITKIFFIFKAPRMLQNVNKDKIRNMQFCFINTNSQNFKILRGEGGQPHFKFIWQIGNFERPDAIDVHIFTLLLNIKF